MRSPVRRLILALGLIVSIVISGCFPASGPLPAAMSTLPAPNVSRDWAGGLPLYFVENGGQLDAQVAYSVGAGPLTAYFTPGSVTYALVGRSADDAEIDWRPSRQLDDGWPASAGSMEAGTDADGARDAFQRWAVRLDLLGADRSAMPVGQEQAEARFNYFRGPEEAWRTDLRTYAGVTYTDIWPGVDLVYGQQERRLKYSFVVRPGASPEQVRFAYLGATSRLNEAGQLVVETPIGGFVDERPVAYQEIDGSRVAVDAAFQHDPDAPSDGGAYGFQVGTYDPSLPLVLDPVVTVYAGYIGGQSYDVGYDLAIDGQGYAYVTGMASSSQASFPHLIGPDLSHNGGGDAFVAKVSPSGDALVYAGYIGGDQTDGGIGIALSPTCSSACDAYVAGNTQSSPATFPAKKPWPKPYGGGMDAFVARVSATGSGLIYAGYVGGIGEDVASAIAVDGSGNAYIAGDTRSDQTTFPVVGNRQNAGYNGGSDGFVCKVNSTGTAFGYCGYFGGAGDEYLRGLAVDRSGRVYLVGTTSSKQGDGFPLLVGPDVTYNGGSYDVFVAKLTPSGDPIYSGYMGGNGLDQGRDIAIRPGCNVSCEAFIVGQTWSANFPATSGWFNPKLKTFNGGSSDAFVARVGASGADLQYAGFVGGDANEIGEGVAVDDDGYVTMVGSTFSTETTFPVKSGPDLTHNGDNDGFVARIDSGGTDLIFAGYIGGADDDAGQAVAVENGASGAAYITLSAGSDQLQEALPVNVGPDLSYNGGEMDALVTKIQPLPR